MRFLFLLLSINCGAAFLTTRNALFGTASLVRSFIQPNAQLRQSLRNETTSELLEERVTKTSWWQEDLGDVLSKMSSTRNAKVRLASLLRKPQYMGVEAGILRLDAEYTEDGLALKGQPMTDLGTLSYLGLSSSERYKSAIIKAVAKYGPTFCISPQWMRHPYAMETTQLVERVFQRPCLISKSCSIASMGFFSSIIKLDASVGVIVDSDAHESLRDQCMAIADVKNSKILKGTSFDYTELERHVEKMIAAGIKTVWYVADGQVSLSGEQIPIEPLFCLQRRFPQLHIFCDDAHGTGWSGTAGRGLTPDIVLTEADTNDMGHADEASKWVFAVSFSKGFGADGGALVLPEATMKDFVELFSPFCRSTSARLPTADLAMINEAMKMSLDGTVELLQGELSSRIEALHSSYRKHLGHLIDIPDNLALVPVLHIPLDMHIQKGIKICQDLNAEGIFVAPTGPPAAKTLGLRVTVQPSTTTRDIEKLMIALKHSYQAHVN